MKKEQSPVISLTKIHADITCADKKAKKVSRINEERIEISKKLFEQASKILQESGKVCQKNVGRGAGGRIIGYRLETENYLETPPVAVEFFKGKKARLVLAGDFTSHSGYNVTEDKVVLTARFDEDSATEPKQIFLIKQDGETQNWLGKPATIKEIDMLKGILSLMKGSLPKINR